MLFSKPPLEIRNNITLEVERIGRWQEPHKDVMFSPTADKCLTPWKPPFSAAARAWAGLEAAEAMGGDEGIRIRSSSRKSHLFCTWVMGAQSLNTDLSRLLFSGERVSSCGCRLLGTYTDTPALSS